MQSAYLLSLIEDATLVADTGIRLGALADDDLVTALAAANQSLAQDTPDPAAVRNLQRALNSAIKMIAPITLGDLHGGWRPYQKGQKPRLSTMAFFFFAIVLMAACAYTTQVYEKARSLYSTTLELQSARGGEQAMRLYGMVKRNKEDVLDSMNSGKREFLYEVFGKALFDLKAIHVRNEAHLPLAASILNEIDMIASPSAALARLGNPTNPTGDPNIQKFASKPSYGATPAEEDRALLQRLAEELHVKDVPGQANAHDVQQVIDTFFAQLRRFYKSIDLNLNVLQPPDHFSVLFQLRNGIGFIGQWILPALYGMLGAVIFHMRRLLDARTPDPTWMRITFRVLLGAFAGIIAVWVITPAAQKVSQGEFSTLTAFGLAFLVGFSTDVFFHALDRLVEYLTAAVNSPFGSRKESAPAGQSR